MRKILNLCVMVLGLSLVACVSAPPTNAEDGTSGELKMGDRSCGYDNGAGVIFGMMRHRWIDDSGDLVSGPLVGAVLEFMTPHTNRVVSATSADDGSYKLYPNDFGMTTGATLTYDGVTYALPVETGTAVALFCEATEYNWILQPNAATGYPEVVRVRQSTF